MLELAKELLVTIELTENLTHFIYRSGDKQSEILEIVLHGSKIPLSIERRFKKSPTSREELYDFAKQFQTEEKIKQYFNFN